MQTEQIDKLFLELSQFTAAVTAKELYLAKTLKDLMDKCPKELQDSPEFLEVWDKAVITLHCMNNRNV